MNQCGKDLSMFIPERKNRFTGNDELRLQPENVKSRPCLKGIGDREQAGQKAWLLLSLKLRCFFRPDDLHSMWNDTRALTVTVIVAAAFCHSCTLRSLNLKSMPMPTCSKKMRWCVRTWA